MTETVRTSTGAQKLYSAVVGLAAVAILLQGVWAGFFIREGKDNDDSWVEVHDWGARVAIFLALVSLVVAVVALRHRIDLIVGSAALFVLLFLEAYLGGLVGESPAVQEIHFPLALGLMGLVVWLPFRARSASGRRADR